MCDEEVQRTTRRRRRLAGCEASRSNAEARWTLGATLSRGQEGVWAAGEAVAKGWLGVVVRRRLRDEVRRRRPGAVRSGLPGRCLWVWR